MSTDSLFGRVSFSDLIPDKDKETIVQFDIIRDILKNHISFQSRLNDRLGYMKPIEYFMKEG